MAKSLVVCEYCGIEFLRDNDQIKRSKIHCCSIACVGLLKSKKNVEESIGKKYGKLTVLSLSHIKNGCSIVNCLCDCGNNCTRVLCDIKRNKPRSCSKCPEITDIERFMSHVEVVNRCLWIWKASKYTNGYGIFRYQGTNQIAHRVAYKMFIGEIPAGVHCCHEDDRRDNVSPYNLFLGTHQDNMDDMIKKGRNIKGEKCWNSKLNKEKASEIRKLHKEGLSRKELAKMFDVCRGTIGAIIRNETWKE